MFKERFDRAIAAMQMNRIDAWFTTGRETNILGEPAFLFLMPAEIMNRAAVILTAEGDRLCIIAPIEAEEMIQSGLFTKVITYRSATDFEDTITRCFSTIIPKRLAINTSSSDPSSDGLSYNDKLLLDRCLAAGGVSVDFVSSDAIMKQIRGRKSEQEVAAIALAVQKAMGIYEQARPAMRVGMSGIDVQMIFQTLIDRNKYSYSWPKPRNPFVSIGTRSSYFCLTPPATVFIEPGDLINVDLGIRVNGFASDNQRSFYALKRGETKAPYTVQHAWETIQAINNSVCAAMKTGVDSNDLTAIGNNIMLDQGYSQGWRGSYGHELGLFAHQGGISAGYNPNKPGLDTRLETNMTFTLEPAIVTTHGRLCQEEVVQVTETGGRMLSTPQSEIWLINFSE